MRRRRTTFALLLLASLAAAPARGLDLTGTWEAPKGLRCKIRSDANSGFTEADGNLSVLEITQVGDDLYVRVNPGDGAYENKFRGVAATHPKDASRGYAVASACTIAGKYYAGSLFVPKARADAGDGSLSLVFHGSRFSTVAECKGKYVRASAADPNLTQTCP